MTTPAQKRHAIRAKAASDQRQAARAARNKHTQEIQRVKELVRRHKK